jgi:hypothetical protein
MPRRDQFCTRYKRDAPRERNDLDATLRRTFSAQDARTRETCMLIMGSAGCRVAFAANVDLGFLAGLGSTHRLKTVAVF